MPSNDSKEGGVLVLAPTGRDAAVLVDLVSGTGRCCTACIDVEDLLSRLGNAQTAIVAEEALRDAHDRDILQGWLASQPPWSDFPFILLGFPDNESDQQILATRDVLQNVTLLERPLRPDTLWRAIGAALRARKRQLEVAQLLAERSRTEELRRVSEERLRELFENAADAILIADANDILIEANPAAFALLGYEREDLVGNSIANLVDAPVRTKLDHLRANRHRHAERAEWRLVHRDRHIIEVEISARVLQDGRLQMFMRDIADRKRAELALRRLNENLESRVEERTAKLVEAQEALAQAQKMEAIGQLTGGIAHDFNNLLMVVSGGLEMLGRRPDEKSQRRLVQRMHLALDRGAALTRQLLTVSRRQAMKPEPLDLDRRIGAMAELLDRSLRGDIRLEMEFAPGLWPIHVDATQLDVAILNIAVNARDAMPEGGTLRIKASNASKLARDGLFGDFVRLSISDTGVGMSPDIQARVFEPFFTTKDIGKGSGLGLAQIYAFCTQSGGAVEIASEVGQGTTITLYLPRSARSAALVRSEGPTEGFESAPEQRQPGGTVLLVEDDDEVAALAADMIDQLGYQVVRVANAAAALGALANGRTIDLVFSDVLMPGGMNGADLVAEIFRRRPGLPVVLATGYDGESLNAAERLGVPLLRKPYRLKDLAATLAGAIRLSEGQESQCRA
jgi:PAS domain S-box-containing protein